MGREGRPLRRLAGSGRLEQRIGGLAKQRGKLVLRAAHLPPLQNDMSRAGGALLGLSQWEGEKEGTPFGGARRMNAYARRARPGSMHRRLMPAAVGNDEFSVTQSGVEVVQDPELSKDDRPLWVAVEAFDLAVFEFEHVAARGVHFLTRGRQLAEGKLQWAIVGTLQG